ncbi:MAG: right-handed parallel beta-helix repeat-containing protein [Lachnospiraceae bacterium]|nr:right-handed parallel beta-helix repeat-containing protein [Lachnospiraceae bacterium]
MDKKLNICTFALVLLLLVSLTGCSGTSDKEEPAVTSEQTSATPAPILAESPSPSEEAVVADEAIHVSTAGEFLEAIAPDVVIELAPGTYNLTEYLRESPDNISDYVTRSFTDGWQADIHEVDRLTIRGSKDGMVEVVAEPRYSDVLYFNDCSDITIENITFGHTIEQGNCEGAVLAFDYCRKISLNALDLYGCGTYGVVADHTVSIALKDCIIRECSYGIVDLLYSDVIFEGCTFRDNGGFDMLSFSSSFAHFDGCSFTGNEGSSFLPSYYQSDSESGARFEHCTFGLWESQCLQEELKDLGSFVFEKNCQFETEITESPYYSEEAQDDSAYFALDMTCLKVASFDEKVLTAKEYYILYEIVNSIYGEVSFETSDDVRFLTFEEDGRGCFWTDNEKGRPFNYEMNNAYSCAISFDDGGKASFGLYADQGGALPESEEGTMWLALYLEGESLWFY